MIITHGTTYETFVAAEKWFYDNISGFDMSKYFEWYITDDFSKDSSKFTTRNLNISGSFIIQKDTGNMVVLIEDGKSFDIIIHELTHVYDYILYANKFADNIIKDIFNTEMIEAYNLWTEFHATYLALYSLLVITQNKKQIQNIYIANIIENIESLDNRATISTDDIMYCFGKIILLNNLNLGIHLRIPQCVHSLFEDFDSAYNTLVTMMNFEDFQTYYQDFVENFVNILI